MPEKFWIALGYSVLFGLCLSCGSLAGGGSGHHGGDSHGGGGELAAHKKSSDPPKINGAVKKKAPKTFANTVIVGDAYGESLYAPAKGYMWSDSKDHSPRTFDKVVATIPESRKK